MDTTTRHAVVARISSTIRSVREAKGLTQEQLGAALPRPVPQTTISRWENGSSELLDWGIVKLLEVEQALGVAPGHILQECEVLAHTKANAIRARIANEPTLSPAQAKVMLALYEELVR